MSKQVGQDLKHDTYLSWCFNRLQKIATWELEAIVKALSMHPWLNTLEENQRLGIAKHILSKRKQSKKSK